MPVKRSTEVSRIRLKNACGCRRKAAGRSERSHYLRFPAPWLAGCSDTGLRHRTNQDALCLAVRGGEPNAAMLALADGVTTAHGSEVASAVATETAIEFMTQGHDRGYAANVEAVTVPAPEPLDFADAPAARRVPTPDTPTIATLVDRVKDRKSVV